ncbi:MAG: hypothetical protein HYY25_02925 [Candidatus Wallbacteria bacterium]|nr:hypothetical protein [Candidatus Wallbacteria bacterium]
MNQADRMSAMVMLVTVALLTAGGAGAAAGQARMAPTAGAAGGLGGLGSRSETLVIVRALPEPILHAREVIVPVAADRLARASWRPRDNGVDWRTESTDEVPSTVQPPSVGGPASSRPSRAVLRDANPLPDAGEVL